MRRELTAVATGIGIGMGVMYFVDPDRGRRRRALVTDKLAHSLHASISVVGGTTRDLAHRSEGMVARVRRAFRTEGVDDDVLIDRVRSRLGRAVSHPHAIRVEVAEGCVTLSGPILHEEVKPLLHAVARVRGICGVVNALDERERDDHVPARLGNTARPPSRRLAPATRVVLRTAGTALAGYGASRRDVRGAVLAATGLGIVVRAARRA